METFVDEKKNNLLTPGWFPIEIETKISKLITYSLAISIA